MHTALHTAASPHHQLQASLQSGHGPLHMPPSPGAPANGPSQALVMITADTRPPPAPGAATANYGGLSPSMRSNAMVVRQLNQRVMRVASAPDKAASPAADFFEVAANQVRAHACFFYCVSVSMDVCVQPCGAKFVWEAGCHGVAGLARIRMRLSRCPPLSTRSTAWGQRTSGAGTSSTQ